MNETVNKFLLARDKFMPKMHLKQPEFTCNACGPFTKNIERIKKKKKKKREKCFFSGIHPYGNHLELVYMQNV